MTTLCYRNGQFSKEVTGSAVCYIKQPEGALSEMMNSYWLRNNRLQMNDTKTEFAIFCLLKMHIHVLCNEINVYGELSKNSPVVNLNI